jgi:hypothetical protein
MVSYQKFCYNNHFTTPVSAAKLSPKEQLVLADFEVSFGSSMKL